MENIKLIPKVKHKEIAAKNLLKTIAYKGGAENKL